MIGIGHWKRRLYGSLFGDPVIAEALAPRTIEQLCRDVGHRWRQSFWTPTVTVVTFLLQVLDAAKTLRAAVADLLTQEAARGETDLPSPDPTAYCQARKRLPAEVLTRLLGHVEGRLRDLVTPTTSWLGHRVWVADGSTVSMPDTPQLQAAFPQPSTQKEGCGFPLAQMVVLFCWTTGAVIDLVLDTIRPHELPMFRKLYHHFRPGDVALADRAYCAYVDMARLKQKGVFGVFRLHSGRKVDFRKGKRLGAGDQLVTWPKSKWSVKFGIRRNEFDHLPETLTVRLVRSTHATPGFRSKTLTIVTTLLDPVQTPADEIRALYRDRWTVELNLRSLKTALGMEILHGKSPDVVRKEITMHLLAYNLIRLLMWQAAERHGCSLHRLSFTGTLHRLRSALSLLLFASTLLDQARLLGFLLRCIAADTVPDRPDRVEPRRVKRRPKAYPLLVKPRDWYRQHRDPNAR